MSIYEFIKYFFRTTNGPISIETFGLAHLILVIIAVLLVIFTLKTKIKNRSMEKFLGYTLLVYNISFYAWYIITGYHLYSEGLPLYYCRIVSIIFTLNFVFGLNFLRPLAAYLGLFGSTTAFVYPLFDYFEFPHYTYFTFLVCHYCILMASFLMLKENPRIVNYVNATKTVLLLILINGLSYFVNELSGGNYNTMSQPPFMASLFENRPTYIYFIFANLFSFLCIAICHKIFNLVKKRLK